MQCMFIDLDKDKEIKDKHLWQCVRCSYEIATDSPIPPIKTCKPVFKDQKFLIDPDQERVFLTCPMCKKFLFIIEYRKKIDCCRKGMDIESFYPVIVSIEQAREITKATTKINFPRKAMGFVSAQLHSTMNGRPSCSQDQIDYKLRQCVECEYFTGKKEDPVGQCLACNGCYINNKISTMNKLAYADIYCPYKAGEDHVPRFPRFDGKKTPGWNVNNPFFVPIEELPK